LYPRCRPFLWGGDQILCELRAPGDTSDNLEVQ
jgi:hypothetical protein